MRYFTWLFLLLILGCTFRAQDKAADAKTLSDPKQALKNLEMQAEEVGRAAVQEDHARMAEFTLPALVEKFGGRAMYIKKLESIAAETKKQGFRLKEYIIGKPSQLVQVAGDAYAVVPFGLELSGPGGSAGRQPSYMVAVSQDGSASWKFVDGAGIGGDRGKLKNLFPNFPDELQLPAAQHPVWDKQVGGSAHPPGRLKTFARRGFTFDYPATWTVNDKDKDYDPDHLVIIDASLGAMVMFVIADAELNTSRVLAAHLQAQSKRMSNPVQTEFNSWGRHKGRGAVLRGNVLGLVRETIRTFVFNDSGKTFTVTESLPDDEEQQLALGYQSLEDSFRVLQVGKGEGAKVNVQDR
jgi:hypothetical protein